MTKPRVLCMVDLTGAAEGLHALKEVADVDYIASDRDVLLRTIERYDALWCHTDQRVDAEVLKRASRLKVINSASTGTNHIDKGLASQQGISVLSITSDYGLLEKFTATAECAWMLMLACLRHLRSAIEHVLEGNWYNNRFCGRQLSDLTLGVLGVGRLGTMVCAYGNAFRMRVLGCDVRGVDTPGVEPVNFEALLAQSDAVTIHIHLTPDNHHLFDDTVLSKMKHGSVLVNTSRGDLIDENALLRALESGRLAAYGADVVHDEWRSNMLGSPVIRYAKDHRNVIITPHMGGATTRSIWEARVFSAKKLAHYLVTGQELTMSGE